MRTLKFGLAGALVVGVLAVLVVTGSAFAQNNPTADTPPAAPVGGGYGPGFGMCGPVGVEAAAKALGLTVEEMQTQLWGGRTLADLADRANVDLQAVQDAVKTACKDQLRAAVEQAVTDGTLTREKADWLLEGLDKGFWGNPGEGPGFGGIMGPRAMGRDGGRGFGRFGGFQRWGGCDQEGWGGWNPGGMRGPGGPGMGRWGGAQPGAQSPNQ